MPPTQGELQGVQLPSLLELEFLSMAFSGLESVPFARKQLTADCSRLLKNIGSFICTTYNGSLCSTSQRQPRQRL